MGVFSAVNFESVFNYLKGHYLSLNMFKTTNNYEQVLEIFEKRNLKVFLWFFVIS